MRKDPNFIPQENPICENTEVADWSTLQRYFETIEIEGDTIQQRCYISDGLHYLLLYFMAYNLL